MDSIVKYIAEGSFGCVFTSKIACKDIAMKNHNTIKYVSKVSVKTKDDLIDKEFMLGKQILDNVNHYDYYFAPILNNCPINIGIIENEEIKKCNIIENNEKSGSTKDYVSSTLKYIGKNSLYDYLDLHHDNENKHIKCILETHQHLLTSLQKLLEMNDSIVHYDIKDGNVMFDELYNVPIIIDYGLSYTKSNLFKTPLSIENLEKIFYVYYEKYTVWNIDVVLLSYITQSIAIKENVNIATQLLQPYLNNLMNVVDDFVKGCILFETDQERLSFTENTQNYLSFFKNKSIRFLIDDLSRKLPGSRRRRRYRARARGSRSG